MRTATAPRGSRALVSASDPFVAGLLGAIVGLTWAAALRSYMVALAGAASAFSWWTLVAILLPGAIAGACIGVAHALRSRRSWLLGLGPFAFTLFTMLEPGAVVALLTTGIGGGAIAVPAILVLGGFGLGTVGSRAARIACLAAAVLFAVATAATVPLVGGSSLAPTTPRGLWVTVLAAGLLLSGMLGTSLAFRRVAAE
jgi:hypothetical protein